MSKPQHRAHMPPTEGAAISSSEQLLLSQALGRYRLVLPRSHPFPTPQKKP